MRRFVLVAAVATMPAMASAHALLVHAEPGAAAVLKSAPREVRLEYSEQLEPSFSSVSVTDAGGRSVEDGAAKAAGAVMTAKLKAVGPGEYRVHWIAVSVDTHRTEGAYSFTVAP